MVKTREKRMIRAISIELAKTLDKIKQERLRLGVDNLKELKSDWRLTLAITRHPNFKLIVSDLMMGELKNE